MYLPASALSTLSDNPQVKFPLMFGEWPLSFVVRFPGIRCNNVVAQTFAACGPARVLSLESLSSPLLKVSVVICVCSSHHEAIVFLQGKFC